MLSCGRNGRDGRVVCHYCGTANAAEENRCRHCGGRVYPSPITTAAVPEPRPESPTQRRPVNEGPPRQGSLFSGPKVIPFETLASGRMANRRRPAGLRRPPAPESREVERGAGQQKLDFHPRAGRRQASVCDDAPVASVGLRLKAAAVDALVFAIGLALAAAAFHYLGGRFVFTARTGYLYAGAAGAMLLAYRLFWCVLGRDPVGMQCCRMRLVTFDGYPPDLRHRLARFAAAMLCVGGGGWGVFWALFDRERLACHDQISQTFPTIRK